MTSTLSSGPDRLAALDELFAGLDRSDAPGAIVAVACGDDLLYRRGFGLASVQHGVANHPETRIRFASVTKQFTSTAAALLAEEGLLDLDAPVSIWLPDLDPKLGAATLRELMAHSSGHRCTLELGSIANGFAPQPPDWQARALSRQRSVQYPPGHEQLYCNGTYVALTAVIERSSGYSFADVLRERIFAPLEMYDSEIVEDDGIMVPGMAEPHVREGDRWRRPQADTMLRGDGGMVSTVDDMLRWLAHLRGPKKIGGEAVWRELLSPFELASGFASTYAMGFKRHRYRGVEVIQHSGGLFGLNTQVISVPDHATDIVIAVNGASVSATRLGFAALDVCLAGQFALPPPTRAATSDFRYLLDQSFALPSGLLVTFGDAEGCLGLSQMHMIPAPMLYEEAETIVALFEEIGFGPLRWRKADLARWRDDRKEGLPVTIAGECHVMQPLVRPDVSVAETLSPAAGRYASPELAAYLTVAVSEGTAMIQIHGDYSRARCFKPLAISERHLGIVSEDGAERYALELDIGDDGTTRGLWIDTHRARRVYFDRDAGVCP